MEPGTNALILFLNKFVIIIVYDELLAEYLSESQIILKLDVCEIKVGKTFT